MVGHGPNPVHCEMRLASQVTEKFINENRSQK
jgi:hypothetical protein